MSGGKGFRVGVLTISDRSSRGESVDRSGPALAEVVERHLGSVVRAGIVADEIEDIRRALREWCLGAGAMDLVLTTGGTGLAPRDRTPEAVSAMFDKAAPNLMELARLRCLEKTSLTYLSRGVAGVIGRTLVLTLPGSPRGAVETLEAIMDILPHAIDTALGEGERYHPREGA